MKFLLSFLLFAVAGIAAEQTKPCVFCEIAAGRLAAPGVWADDSVVAFMDRAPRCPGHVLIMPAQHADNYLVVPPATLEKMILLAQRIGDAVRRTDLGCEGLQVQMNTGQAAGQTVPARAFACRPALHGRTAPKIAGRGCTAGSARNCSGKNQGGVAVKQRRRGDKAQD